MVLQIHGNDRLQLLIGLLIGVGFGFCLNKGGVTNYDVIIGQLLLTDFTVLKLMLTAVLVGIPGIHLMKSLGWADFHTFKGSAGSTVIGGLMFGIGFGLLGYCPGTVAGAIGHGQLDALLGGAVGLLIGTAVYAEYYPGLKRTLLSAGPFPAETIPEMIHLSRGYTAVGFMGLIAFTLLLLEYLGF